MSLCSVDVQYTYTTKQNTTIGYEHFTVKPYIPSVVRCFNCQRLGHVASNCRSSTRCVRCGGPHAYDQCHQKDSVKWCRCGGSHSSAYECIRVSYADAAKAIKTNISIQPDTDTRPNPTPQPNPTIRPKTLEYTTHPRPDIEYNIIMMMLNTDL